MLVHAVDYASGARCGLRASPCGLRTLMRAVDYASGARCGLRTLMHAVDFPALRARVQEIRGDSNQARDSVRKPCKCALARRWFFEPWKGDSL